VYSRRRRGSRRAETSARFRLCAREASRVRGKRVLRVGHLWRFRDRVLPGEVLASQNRQRWQPADGSGRGRGRSRLRPAATRWWRLVTAAAGR